MPLPSMCVRVAAVLLLCAPPLEAQHDDRVWGRVLTEDGEMHEGFIHLARWRAAASWADVFTALKEIPEQHYRDWLDATRGGEPHVGTVELKGYRITWEQKHPAFERPQLSGIRLGHIAALTIGEEEQVRVATRSDGGTRFEPGDTVAADEAVGLRAVGLWGWVDHMMTLTWSWSNTSLRIENGGRQVEIEGEDVVRIEFGGPPSGNAPGSPRLYGTVEDRGGRSFTGFVTWDRRQVLESQSLTSVWRDVPGLANPWESGQYERSFRFSELRSLERTPCFAKATLKSDTVMELCLEPFEPDPWPVQISDPELGLVEVEWDAVRTLRFEPSPGLPGYDAFDGGRPLSGTVVTRHGEEITGRIRWDADEEWSWELLQGSSDGVDFSIEFGYVARIERRESEGALVTLRDGRSFHLTGGYDVGRDNRGIFIFPAPAQGAVDGAAEAAGADPADGAEAGKPEPPWRYVAWEDFREVRFHPVGETGSGS